MQIRDIVMDSIVDGSGIRMTLFFQGCPHHCNGCHNPDTWSYDEKVNEFSVEYILELFDSDSILSGITLSGGEPFSQRNFEELKVLLPQIKSRGKNVWVYTGYTIESLIRTFPDIVDTLFPYIDVIVDGPFIMEKRNLLCRFRGSENQRLIDLKKYLNGEIDFEYV